MLDVSGSMAGNLPLLRAAATQLFPRLLPEDLARVGAFGHDVTISPTFTRNPEELVAALPTTIVPDSPTPLWRAMAEALDALREKEDARKVVLVLSDGKDSGPIGFRQRPGSQADTIDRARAEDVMIYAIGLRSRNMRSMPPGAGRAGMQAMLLADLPDPGLARVAEETGGGYIEIRYGQDLGAAFAGCGRRAPHPVSAGLRAAQTRRQGARDRREGRQIGSETQGTKELRRAERGSRAPVRTKNRLAGLAAICLAMQPALAWAQLVEVAPLGGYRFGGDFFELVTNQPVDLDGAPVFGVVVNFVMLDGLSVEGLFSHQEARVTVPGGAFASPTRWRVTVDQWLAGGLQEFGYGRVRPFLTGLLGLTRYAGEGDNEIRFAVSAGGGVKLWPVRRLGVRLDGRVFATFVELEGRAIACSPGICLVAFDSRVAWQGEFSAGLVFAF